MSDRTTILLWVVLFAVCGMAAWGLWMSEKSHNCDGKQQLIADINFCEASVGCRITVEEHRHRRWLEDYVARYCGAK